MPNADEFLKFEFIGDSASGKTSQWMVTSTMNGANLGHIQWNCGWRRYCFHPNSLTLYDAVCLTAISEFIKERMCERQNAANS